jgi:hypothetical protein
MVFLSKTIRLLVLVFGTVCLSMKSSWKLNVAIVHLSDDIDDGVPLFVPKEMEVIKSSFVSDTSVVPYYLHGRFGHLQDIFNTGKQGQRELIHEAMVSILDHSVRPTFRTNEEEVDQETWVLPDALLHPTRNHDSVILEYHGKHLMVTAFGRFNENIEVMDLHTGEQWYRAVGNGTDPDGLPLNQLNHVQAVVVDRIDKNTGQLMEEGKKEIWLPCGFVGHEIDFETTVNYTRILDLDTLEVRVGPKLPTGGSGACVATALTIIQGEPPMICVFGGTVGSHDSGIFQPYTICYDRLREKWWFPMGTLPYGIDHASIAVVPPSTCQNEDPGRIILLNYRDQPYGVPVSKMLAFDLPRDGWTIEQLSSPDFDMNQPGKWYVHSDIAHRGRFDKTNCPRDASGVVVANGGRNLINFGGVFHIYPGGKYNIKKLWRKKKHVFSNIRSYDVCEKKWETIGDLGIPTFALTTTASEELQIAVTCGGTTIFVEHEAMSNDSIRFCTVNRLKGIQLSNRHGTAAQRRFGHPLWVPGRALLKRKEEE